jgi:hypothetical protein
MQCPLQVGKHLRLVRFDANDDFPSMFRASLHDVLRGFLRLHANNERLFLCSNLSHFLTPALFPLNQSTPVKIDAERLDCQLFRIANL